MVKIEKQLSYKLRKRRGCNSHKRAVAPMPETVAKNVYSEENLSYIIIAVGTTLQVCAGGKGNKLPIRERMCKIMY